MNESEYSASAWISFFAYAEGKRYISYDNYAIACVKDLEAPASIRAHFSLGY